MEGAITIVVFMIIATLNYFILGVDSAHDFLAKLWLMVIGYLVGVLLFGNLKKTG